MSTHAFLVSLGHFIFWMGMFKVFRWNRLKTLIPKHMWKSIIGPIFFGKPCIWFILDLISFNGIPCKYFVTTLGQNMCKALIWFPFNWITCKYFATTITKKLVEAIETKYLVINAKWKMNPFWLKKSVVSIYNY